MADMKKYLDTTALGTLVDQIKSEDAKVLQSAKDYADGLATNYEEAGSAATAESNAKTYADEKVTALANGAVKTNTDAIAKLNGGVEVEGSVAKAVADAKATIDADITAVDEKADKNAEDIAAINHETTGILATAKGYTDTEVAKVQGKVDTLETTVGELDAYVGDIPEGYTEANVIAYINKKAEETLASATGGSSESAASVLAALNTYKAENDPKVAANTKAAADAQAAADSAQEYAEGVASDLAKAVEDLEAVDAGQETRIATLEGQITGLTGAMHFKGVVDELPEDVSTYANGDVIVVGEKEYVFNDGAFVEFGDVSAEGERIAALETHKTQYEAKVATLEGEMNDVEAAVALKADKTALDAEVEARTNVDTALDERLQVIEGKFEGDESVATQIASAKQEAIDAAKEDATTKANAAESNAKAHADAEVAKVQGEVDALEEVVNGKAAQADLTALTTRVETAEGEIDTLQSEMDAVESKAAKNETDIATANTEIAKKANQTDLDAAELLIAANDEAIKANAAAIALKASQEDLTKAVERIATNEANIAANTSAINSFTPITTSEVEALFA